MGIILFICAFLSYLFRICREKKASVADLMQYANGVLHWDVNFIRVVQDWELESLSHLMDMIYGVLVRGNEEDKMCWKPDKKKGFTWVGTIGFYLAIVINLFLGNAFGNPRFLLKLLSSFGLQLWRISWRLIIYGERMCMYWIGAMCKRNGESIDHLLLHCPWVAELWSMVLDLFGVYWVM